MNRRTRAASHLDRALLALPLALILTTCGGDDCSIDPYAAPGTYTVTNASRAALVGATVTIVGDTLSIRYTLPDGSSWRARYRVEDAWY